ncbi:uncharacterized protein LOC111323450 [Stylophora pistillata]|uniref:DUF8206 domain-containing protein n=1 Tax=Stylophora pistillata TaxID=50429 RepID=A0A2B4SPT7_STYPI|nr:uncharacterized protein LOC111323450 [Stylophora pistillata]PFX30532.1 hypothetical protein AWC38_SpisGene4698 [Stylophora pistillata]
MASPEVPNDLADAGGTESNIKGPQVEASAAKEEINILILGETGVGKSTWINGIANYAKHESLQDAMNDPDFTVLIPSRFTFTNEIGEEINIAFGAADDNEVLSSGQSATQFPQEYRLETNTTIFYLIDTPGIGDCRGIKKDKENFENILSFLTCYEKINAVVVLLKPNNARLTVAFKFCVLELLTHLHKSLVSNIMFAFTNSRGTFYRPGDSLPVLKKLLDDNSIEIDVSPSNYFCFDNEAFRFLACHKSGINFTSEDIDLYSKSWVKSCDTTCRLFERVKSMTPHDTKKTLSLNEARNCIIALSKPMGQAVELIEMNLKKIKDVKDQCQTFEKDIKEFQRELRFKGFDLEVEPLDYPMTVCAATACKRYVPVGKSGQQNIVYEQVCHDHCNLSGVAIETTNNDQLHGCCAMSDGKCRFCGHNYREHMHIRYTANVVEKEFLSEEAQSEIKKKTDLKSQKQSFIRELEKNIKELEEEKKFIYECASYFGVFLKQNAMLAYNDSFCEYLDMLIREEEMKEKVIRDEGKIAQMKKDKQTYEEKKNVIIENIKKVPADGKKAEVMPIEKINEMRAKLCSLRHNGKTLREALDGIISTRLKNHKTKAVSKSCVYAKTNNSWIPGFFYKINPFKSWGSKRRSNFSISQF